MSKLLYCLPLLLTFSVYADYSEEFLDQVYYADEFRILYTLQGTNALIEENQIDNNQNNIPDFIENIATKFKNAQNIYTQQFKLTAPLSSNRYQNKAINIDIYVHDIETHGNAGDEVINERFPQTTKTNHKVLSINLSRSLTWNNHSPEHELFHLFQNGYSMFKNRWYTEGTARWSEQAFLPEAKASTFLPSTQEDLELLTEKTYDAMVLWNRITYLCDSTSQIDKPADSMQTIYGTQWIKAFLEQMQLESVAASKERDLPRYQWPENVQKQNSDNNQYIFRAIRKTMLTHCSASQLKTPEVADFLSLLKELHA